MPPDIPPAPGAEARVWASRFLPPEGPERPATAASSVCGEYPVPIDRTQLQIIIVDRSEKVVHDDLVARLSTGSFARVQDFRDPDAAKDAITSYAGPTLVIFFLPQGVQSLVNHVRFFRRGLAKRVELLFVASPQVSESIERAYRDLGAIGFLREDHPDYLAVQVEQVVESPSSFRYRLDGVAAVSSVDVNRRLEDSAGNTGVITDPAFRSLPAYDPSASASDPAGTGTTRRHPTSPGQASAASASGTGNRSRSDATSYRRRPTSPGSENSEEAFARTSAMPAYTPPPPPVTDPTGGGSYRSPLGTPSSPPLVVTTPGMPLTTVIMTAVLTMVAMGAGVFFYTRVIAPVPTEQLVTAADSGRAAGAAASASLVSTPAALATPFPTIQPSPAGVFPTVVPQPASSVPWPSAPAVVTPTATPMPQVWRTNLPEIRAAAMTGQNLEGTAVEFEGIVIFGDGAYVPHRNQYVVMANGAGIVVDDPNKVGRITPTLGDRVRVSGQVAVFRNMLQVRPLAPTVLLPGRLRPEDVVPRTLTIPEMTEATEGTLVRIERLVQVPPSLPVPRSATNFEFSDVAGNRVAVYIDSDTNIPLPLPQQVSALVGIVYQFGDSADTPYILYCRMPGDVVP